MLPNVHTSDRHGMRDFLDLPKGFYRQNSEIKEQGLYNQGKELGAPTNSCKTVAASLRNTRN